MNSDKGYGGHRGDHCPTGARREHGQTVENSDYEKDDKDRLKEPEVLISEDEDAPECDVLRIGISARDNVPKNVHQGSDGDERK